MSKIMTSFCVAFLVSNTHALKLDIHVSDESGQSVTNAVVELATEADRMGRLVESPRMRYETWAVDKTGHAKGKFSCYSAFMHMTTKAPGFYDEYEHVKFKTDGDSFFLGAHIAEKRRDFKVVLRRKINPIPMYSYGASPDIKMPSSKGRFGFDMIERDWVAPYGNGHVVDFYVEYESRIEGQDKFYSATLGFPNKCDGAYKRKKNRSHTFRSDYLAEEEGDFLHRLPIYSFKLVSGKCSIDCFVSNEDYLVLRTRSRTNERGQLMGAHYSKIYGEITVGKSFRFRSYVFNPTENDVNLEYDPKYNLVPKSKRRKMGGGEP